MSVEVKEKGICTVCTLDDDREVLYEPDGLRTRVYLDESDLVLYQISNAMKTIIPIRFCPKCGKKLEKRNEAEDYLDTKDKIVYHTDMKGWVKDGTD